MILPVVLVVVLLLGDHTRLAERCPSAYMRITTSHTSCLPPNKNCNLLETGLQSDDVEKILRYHNEYRSFAAMGKETLLKSQQAANMLEMEWSTELAAIAQSHANQCKFSHDCPTCRQTSDFSVGQNLYESTWSGHPSVQINPKPNWKQAIEAWYNEVADFCRTCVSSFNPSSVRKMIGHCSQVLWAKSWKVGCGYAKHRNKNTVYQLYTCNYGPSGNYVNEPVYEVGKPCSKCPTDTCCGPSCTTHSAKYDGLCKVSDGQYPKYLPKGVFTFSCTFDEVSGCPYEVTAGTNKWETTKSLSGSFLGITLNGGESSTVTFTQPIPNASQRCIQVHYRMSRNKGTLAARLEIVTEYNTLSTPLPAFTSKEFSVFSWSVALRGDIQIKLSVNIPTGVQSQFFELKYIFVQSSACVN